MTDDPNGAIGITLAGYTASTHSPSGVGEIDHYEITGSDGGRRSEWGGVAHVPPRPQLTGNAGGTTPTGSMARLLGSVGGLLRLRPGGLRRGHLHVRLACPSAAPPAGPASTPRWWAWPWPRALAATGRWPPTAASSPSVAAGFFGSMGGAHLNAPIVGMAATPDGGGYWEVAADGGIFSFGDARFFGSMGGRHLNSPIVGISSSTDGGGYRLVAADGGHLRLRRRPVLRLGGRGATQPTRGQHHQRHQHRRLLGGGRGRRRVLLRRRSLLRLHWEHPTQCAHRGHGRGLQRQRLPVHGRRRGGVRLRQPPSSGRPGASDWPGPWWAWPASDPRRGRAGGRRRLRR